MNESRAVRIWLLSVCLLITLMISIGGVTRLTGSGLSITDWQPIIGAIPPLSDTAWEEAFANYREIPQYQLLNSHISLGEFKFLYFWEWFHRLIGRLIGVVAFLPGIYFLARKRITSRLAGRVAFGIFLGGLQGALGWFMVKSGLVERTSVSHYRLAAHLFLALIILSYFVWLTRSVSMANRPTPASEKDARSFVAPKFPFLVGAFVLQILYGAFVAGMKAGFAFNTFPLMMGAVVPSNLFELSPTWKNLFENPATIQWIHRTLGWIVFFSSTALWIALLRRKTARGPIRRFVTGLAHLTIMQFLLGVATLVLVVPVTLGVLHQLGAALIVVFLTLLAHALHQARLRS